MQEMISEGGEKRGERRKVCRHRLLTHRRRAPANAKSLEQRN